MKNLSDDIKIKFLNNRCSDSELQAVKEWLDESDANASELFEAELIADRTSELRADDPACKRIEAKVRRRIENGEALEKRRRRIRFVRTLGGIAAVLAIIFGAGIYLLRTAETKMVYVASADKSMSVVLPDSSVVYLNKNSRLGYPEYFAGNSRRVELDGEGYFEVSHDENRPFHVQGRHLNVEVLGTHFNFVSHDSAQNSVSLIEGSVEVHTADRRHGVVLEPGQKASYSVKSGHLTVHNTNTSVDAAWHDRMIPFENANLKDIVEILQRLYDDDIVLDSNADLSKTYSGSTVYCADLESTLTRLGNTLPIRFIFKDGKTVIYSK